MISWLDLAQPILGLSGWLFALWVCYCRWRDHQAIIALSTEVKLELENQRKHLAKLKGIHQTLKKELEMRKKENESN